MYSPIQQAQNKDEAAALRREAGLWLKEKREALGMSQRELAVKVGIEYYTFISQIEAGRGRVPADRYEAYAAALNVPPREFTLTMLSYNEPAIYRLLQMEDKAVSGASGDAVQEKSILTAMEKRLAALESLMKG